MEIEKIVKTLTDAATKELSVQTKQTRISYEELKKENARLMNELEWAKRERDAAVEDLRKVCKATEACFCCESYDATLAEYVSNDCMDCIKHCNWQWRALKE